MGEFPSYRSYRDFAFSVARHWRYALPRDMIDFLETVLATSREKEESVPVGSAVFRAQLGHAWRPDSVGEGMTDEFPCAFPPERQSGLDGVAYRSAVGPGHNIAIFDPATRNSSPAAWLKSAASRWSTVK